MIRWIFEFKSLHKNINFAVNPSLANMRKRLLEAEAALRATSSKRVKVEQEQSDDEDEVCK